MNTESLSPGVKRPGCGVNQSPPSRAEVKETEELYVYTLCVFTAGYSVNFPLLLDYVTMLFQLKPKEY
jgi:hypothetical protein